MAQIYEFNSEDAFRFAREQGIQIRNRGNELIFRKCPYCRSTSNDKEKFAINMHTGMFHCFRGSCGAKGNMLTLAKDFNFELSGDVTRYYNQNGFNDKFKKFRDAHKEIESKPEAIRFLQSRGISESICKQYEITNQKDNILVFPFKDQNGELQFIKYRKTDFDKTKDKNKEWCEANCKPILFGMNHCDTEYGSLIITEGQIDSLSVAEAGLLNAVSVPTGCNGFTWIPYCWDWFQSFKELIIFGDCEKGKITLTELKDRFEGIVRVVRFEDYQGCKDANELLQKYGKEAVINAVTNAEIVPDVHIKSIADVEDIDLDNIECIKTNIPKIDELLSGGLHIGELILLTGKRGDGKSTFMSQIITSAINQGYNTFAYSGELTNSFFKAWIDKQIIGKWKIYPSEKERLNLYYRNKLFLYDSNLICEGNETEVLLQTVEIAIKQYNCRFICIDNLMTAITSDTNDKLYRTQSDFVGKLKKLAQKFDCVVVLVAHPRKSNGYQFQNDDVSGSSDITNKVDVVMSYNRPADNDDAGFDETCRELIVTKNRLTGKLTNKNRKIFLYYCDENKRIVGEDKQFNYYTGWNGEDFEATEEPTPFDEE